MPFTDSKQNVLVEEVSYFGGSNTYQISFSFIYFAKELKYVNEKSLVYESDFFIFLMLKCLNIAHLINGLLHGSIMFSDHAKITFVIHFVLVNHKFL